MIEYVLLYHAIELEGIYMHMEQFHLLTVIVSLVLPYCNTVVLPYTPKLHPIDMIWDELWKIFLKMNYSKL